MLRLFHVVSLNLNSINDFNDYGAVEAVQQPRGAFRTMETDTSFAQTARNPLSCCHQSPSSYGPAPPPPDSVQRPRMHALPSPWTRAPRGHCLGCSPGSGDSTDGPNGRQPRRRPAGHAQHSRISSGQRTAQVSRVPRTDQSAEAASSAGCQRLGACFQHC